MRKEFTRKVKAKAFIACGGKCQKCYQKIIGTAEFDHIKPCALGGDNSIENLQVLCTKCHKQKTHIDVGRIRKADRQRDKASGAAKKETQFTRNGRRFKKRFDGTVVDRNTGDVVK